MTTANPYKKILIEKYGTEEASRLMTWVKKFNTLRLAGYGDMTPKQIEWIDAEWDTIKYSDSDDESLEKKAVALLAELKSRKETKGRVTVNLATVCENDDNVVMKLLFTAQSIGIIDLFRVAPPYQIAFYY